MSVEYGGAGFSAPMRPLGGPIYGGAGFSAPMLEMGGPIYGGAGFSAPIDLTAAVANSGSAYFGATDQFLLNARAVPLLPGFYDVAVHGTPTAVQLRSAGGADIMSNHRVLAKLIQRQPDYAGQPIRLISCSTGALPDGVAANLSNKLGVKVIAPDTLIWPAPRGGLPVFAADQSGNIVIVKMPADGLAISPPITVGLPSRGPTAVPTFPFSGQLQPFVPRKGP